jgi:hypothetical protein
MGQHFAGDFLQVLPSRQRPKRAYVKNPYLHVRHAQDPAQGRNTFAGFLNSNFVFGFLPTLSFFVKSQGSIVSDRAEVLWLRQMFVECIRRVYGLVRQSRVFTGILQYDGSSPRMLL